MTLREAAQGSGVDVGVALGLGHLTQDSPYAALAAREYNLVTAENECKTNSIARGWTSNDYSACESIYEFTKLHNMKFRGHNLLWANVGQDYYQPSFVQNE